MALESSRTEQGHETAPDSDVAIAELISAFYAAFDNRKAPFTSSATAALLAIFARGAIIARVADERVETWTVEEFIAPREAILSDGTLTDFHEWEVSAETEVYYAIACRRSRYRKVGKMNGVPFTGEGRKFIQLARSGERWMISSILWQDHKIGQAIA